LGEQGRKESGTANGKYENHSIDYLRRIQRSHGGGFEEFCRIRNRPCYLLHAGFSLLLFFETDVEGDMFK
jgi:hypothetical protein